MLRLVLGALVALASAGAQDYCFGFLNANPDRKPIAEAEANQIQEGHMAHMRRKGQEGHLLAAGPIANGGALRGILIYRCGSVAEAMKHTEPDPTVVNKRLVAEFHRWAAYGNIGEPLASEMKADPNRKIEMTRLPLVIASKTDKWTDMPPAEMMQQHAARVMELIKQGKVRTAGPWVDDDGQPTRARGTFGAYVLAAMPQDEAKAIIDGDPLVKNGYATYQIYEWFVADRAIPKQQP